MADRWRREGFQAWDVLCIQGMERMQLLRLQKRDEVLNDSFMQLKVERTAIADLINQGFTEKAMAIRIHNAGTATGILESFLNMLRTPIDMLSKRTEIPNELRTELLSLVYASSRWADVPELAAVRMAFEVIFGKQAFSEVTKDEVDPSCGVQDLLLKCLSDSAPNLCEKLAMAENIMEELGTVEWSRADLEAAAVGAKYPTSESAHDEDSSDEDEASDPDDSAHEDSVAESPTGAESTACSGTGCSRTGQAPTSHRLPDDAVAASESQEGTSADEASETTHDLERLAMMPQVVEGQKVTLKEMPDSVKPTFINGASQRVVKELPCGPGVCVILDDTCSDSIVADTSVSDALLVCDGAGCNVTFSNVTFHNCSVRVLTGARVTFNSCVFAGPTDSQSKLLVFAQDSETQVSFTSCKFVGGAGAVAIQAAAEASITSCSFMGVRKVAVSVYGEKSVLKMANSKLKRQLPKSKRGNTSSFVDKDGFLGVCVTEKADAQLRDIEMRDLLRGLLVQSATATVHECSQRHVGTGYSVYNSSKVVLDGCTNVASDCPVTATDEFELEATNCEFRDFMVADLQSRGLYLQGPGTAVLKKCKMVGTEQGSPQVALPTSFQESYTPALVAAHGEVNLTMEKCVLAKSSNCGLHVLKNFSAPVLVSACQFSEACYFGVKAAACTTEVQLVDCVMKDNRQYGAGCVDATIHATRCHGSSNGWGAFHAKASGVFGESCSLVLKKCSSYRDLCGFSCEGSPDTISISPQLTLEEMLVRKSKLAGYAFKHYVRGTMTNCAAVQCGSNGIEFWGNGQASFKVLDCTSKQNLCCGVHVSEAAGVDNVIMEKVCCFGNKAAGFENENPNSRLLLRQCESVQNELPYNSGMWGTESLFTLEDCQPPGKMSLLSQNAKPSRGNQPGSGKGRGKKPNKKKGSKKR